MYKLILPFILLLSITYATQAQESNLQKKNSIGISVEPTSHEQIDDPTPTFKLDYRRALKNDLGLRFAFIYKPALSSHDQSLGFSAGLQKILFKSDNFKSR